MRLAMIDNYDSFTYNLVQYLGELGAQVDVFRNDAIGVDELLARRPQGVVISPGPGEPSADFVIEAPRQHGLPRLVHLFGIESPGLTSALSLAEEVAGQLAS